MRSVLRFLAFVALLTAAVAALYVWKTSAVAPVVSVNASSLRGPGMPALAEIDREFTALVNGVLPSVVSINAIPPDDPNPRMEILRNFFGLDSGTAPPQMGSGVLVSQDGHIVTNFHVIEGAASVQVSLSDGRVFPARFLGADEPSDIAILKIDAPGLRPIAWGNSDDVLVGQMVFAVGNPLGLQETVTQGIISAKGRRASSEVANEFFQTDAAINRGNSGGPLVDLRGELIGINNLVPVQAQGIAFAIPANTVRRVFESIRDHGRFIRPWFGARMLALTPQLVRQLGLADGISGALVMSTYPGSPAEKAGLLTGDVITDFNSRPIHDHIDLRNRMTEAIIGQTATLKVQRNGHPMEIKVLIAPEPAS